mgnify:CR=1 FL=1
MNVRLVVYVLPGAGEGDASAKEDGATVMVAAVTVLTPAEAKALWMPATVLKSDTACAALLASSPPISTSIVTAPACFFLAQL